MKTALPPPRVLYASFEQAGMHKVHRPDLRNWKAWPCFEEALALSGMPLREFAIQRMHYAIEREEQIARDAQRCCPPGKMEEWSVEHPERLEKLRDFYHEAFLAAVWTSAHARYLSQLESSIREPPYPSVHSVPSALNDLDLTEVFARRTCHQMCPKEAQPMLSVLCRCTNPGSRGWDSLLDQSLANSSGVRLCCVHAVVVAMTGLHPFLHPVLRPTWQERMRLMELVPALLHNCDAVRKGLVKSAEASKEAVRRMLATLVHVVPATYAAMHKVGHPIGFLVSPPQQLPAKGLEAAMAAFVYAGSQLRPGDAYESVVKAAFARQAQLDTALRWDAPWLGTMLACHPLQFLCSHCSLPQVRAPPPSTPRCPWSPSPPKSSPPPSAPTSSPSGPTP